MCISFTLIFTELFYGIKFYFPVQREKTNEVKTLIVEAKKGG